MGLSPANYFGLVDNTNPKGDDSRTIADNQFREILTSLKFQFPNLDAEVRATEDDLNLLEGLFGANAKVMTGTGNVTQAVFINNTPPINWTLITPDSNIRSIVIGPASGGGDLGGTQDPIDTTLSINTSVTVNLPANTNSHTLTESQIPSHNHGIPYRASSGGTSDALGSSGSGTVLTFDSNFTGGGQGHSHPLPSTATGSGTDSVSVTPRYARGIMALLNA